MKPVLVSGIQPTGQLHIGNYLGALKNFVDIQNSGKYQCYFFIADLHSLTEEFDPKEKPKQIMELLADYLAAGLDPHESTIYKHSEIPAHSELAWIFNTITPMGELYRMTQFKDKAKSGKTLQNSQVNQSYEDVNQHIREMMNRGEANGENYNEIANVVQRGLSGESFANVGLFDYPVLMAADILLYDAKFVPVGNDQDQHLELARTLARKFNSKFGKTFVEPQGLHTKTPRVMSLKNPEKKMSKSDPAGCLFIDDSPEEIRKKIMSAVTDSDSKISYDREKKPGLSSLIEIAAALRDEDPKDVVKKFSGKNYGEFKSALAALVADHFKGFREKKKELLAKPRELAFTLHVGSKRAAVVAEKKMIDVKKKIGIFI